MVIGGIGQIFLVNYRWEKYFESLKIYGGEFINESRTI